MPIDLTNKDDLDAFVISAKTASASPKLFDKTLTGNTHSSAGFFDKNAARLETFLKAPLKLNEGRRLESKMAMRLHYLLNTDSEELAQQSFDGQTYSKSAISRIVIPTLGPSDWVYRLVKDAGKSSITLPVPFDELALNAIDKSWTKLKASVSLPFDLYVHAQVEDVIRLSKNELTASGATKTTNDVHFNANVFVLVAPKAISGVTAVDCVRNAHPAGSVDAVIKASISNLLQNPQTPRALMVGTDLALLTDNYGDHAQKINDAKTEMFIDFATDHLADAKTADEIAQWLKDLNLYRVLKDQSVRIHSQLTDMTVQYLRTIDTNLPADVNQKKHFVDLAHTVLTLFAHLESLDTEMVTTDDFARLYQEIKALSDIRGLDAAQKNSLTATHLRLMLAQNLAQLDVLSKNNLLYHFQPKNAAVTASFQKMTGFSAQQKALLLTKEPLALGTAGAGSGKSHTLVGRLDYLQKQGEDMSRVLVLSFTNVAADNITQRYPKVKSVTLGNLFNQIYQENFPEQVLSTPTTLVNSLALVNPKNAMFKAFNPVKLTRNIAEFRAILSQIDARGFKRVNLNVVMSQLATFIANHFTVVTTLLNAVRQTTLDLEPIIIHFLLLNNRQALSVPKVYQDLNFIITDESQDISTFEYILLITLTLQYQANLMIIGDGAQTLYEFRNSNPKFLNAIEASGVFKTYKLTTNYRSKQAILTYANQFLRVIDANKYARIQLTSAAFQKVTKTDFDKAVKIYEFDAPSLRKSEYEGSLGRLIETDPEITDWLLKRIRKDEQVAILAHTHAELDAATEALQHLLDRHSIQKEITVITPNRERSKTLISQAIRNADFTKIPVNRSHAKVFTAAFKDAILSAFKNPAKAFIPAYVDKALQALTTSAEYRAYVREIMAGRMNRRMLDGFIVSSLLNEEIRLNAVASYLNKEVPRQDYDKLPIIASTVHSAKGLEFQHVLVLYNEARKGATSQENLRLFGVALTRAKESELIINTTRMTPSRVVTSDLSGMFHTPMSTALLRCHEDLDAQAKAASGALPTKPIAKGA